LCWLTRSLVVGGATQWCMLGGRKVLKTCLCLLASLGGRWMLMVSGKGGRDVCVPRADEVPTRWNCEAGAAWRSLLLLGNTGGERVVVYNFVMVANNTGSEWRSSASLISTPQILRVKVLIRAVCSPVTARIDTARRRHRRAGDGYLTGQYATE
jgi:hypothetical protein